MNTNGARTARLIDWTEYDPLLGQLTDREIADMIGCTEAAVYGRRKKAGVKPKFTTHWTQEQESEYLRLHASGLRQCRKCGQIKAHSEYSNVSTDRHNGRDGLNRWCRTCKAEYQAQRIEARRLYWLELAGNACQNCGWNAYSVSLDFHHVDGDSKEWSPGKLIMSRPIGDAEVRAELEKCALLCCNCHQAIHRGMLELKFEKRDGLGWTTVKSRDT